MHIVYDSDLWWLHLIYDYDLRWLCFEPTRCDMLIHDDLIKQLVWLVVTRIKQNCKCTLLTSYQWRLIWIYFISSWIQWQLCAWYTKAWEIPDLGGCKLTARINKNSERNWNRQQYAGKTFKSRAIVGHWYPIVSIYFYENAMTTMMVLSQGYALVFGNFDVRKSFQGLDRLRDCVVEKGMPTKLWRQVTARKRWPNFPRDCVEEKGRTRNEFVLVINISRWNLKHTGSVHWNNELITIHWEKK